MEITDSKVELLFHCQMTEATLEKYRQFHALTEEYWESVNSEITKEMNSCLLQYSRNDHYDIVTNYACDFKENEDYLDIHQKSTVVGIYSFFEYRMNDLCSFFPEVIDSEIKLKDLSRQGFERSKNYLRKVVCLSLSGSISQELGYIKKVNLLRNRIVHNGSVLSKDEKNELNKFVSENRHLYGRAGDSFSMDSAFIIELIENIISFCKKLGLEVLEYINNRKKLSPDSFPF